MEPDIFSGRLFRRGDRGYEEARVGRVFNARRPERYPAAVLLATSEDDVLAGVRLAGEEGWSLSVRSGGHSWAAWSVREDGLLIDLGGVREMSYDDATGIATISPAVRGGLDLALGRVTSIGASTNRGKYTVGGCTPTSTRTPTCSGRHGVPAPASRPS